MESRKIFKKLIPLQVKLEPKQREALYEYARERKESVAAVVREWIEKEIIRTEAEK